jgi:hypothetical protein
LPEVQPQSRGRRFAFRSLTSNARILAVMSVQLDLFLDSRAVVLANEAVNAIAARCGVEAARWLAQLRDVASDHPNLQSLETLARGLAEWQQPRRDAAQIEAAARWLEQITPIAGNALGTASNGFVAAFFRELAQASRGLPYDPAHPRAHLAWLCLRCGDWDEAEQAALAIPCSGPQQSSDALHWLTVARHRQRGLSAARPTLFALAWQEPQRMTPLLGELGDDLLDRDFRSFECVCDWTDIEPAELPAWFPAWYVLEHPAVAKEVETMEVFATAPARAAQLLARIVELERQADWKRIVSLRDQLRVMNADLFALYMARRAVRYAR